MMKIKYSGTRLQRRKGHFNIHELFFGRDPRASARNAPQCFGELNKTFLCDLPNFSAQLTTLNNTSGERERESEKKKAPFAGMESPTFQPCRLCVVESQASAFFFFHGSKKQRPLFLALLSPSPLGQRKKKKKIGSAQMEDMIQGDINQKGIVFVAVCRLKSMKLRLRFEIEINLSLMQCQSKNVRGNLFYIYLICHKFFSLFPIFLIFCINIDIP